MRIAIAGYGNVGRGVEAAAGGFPDLVLSGIFTRRPREVAEQTNVPVWPYNDAAQHVGEVDTVIICGGSADDLPVMSPYFARYYNIADSFDSHENMSEHIARVGLAARGGGHVAVTAAGWDPGLMSLARLYFAAVLPGGETLTRWGPGVSRGHTEVLRRMHGVAEAVQFTVPDKCVDMPDLPESGNSAGGSDGDLRQAHRRECYIVPLPGTDTDALADAIRRHPYFEGYKTDIIFVTQDEFDAIGNTDRHGGLVVRRGDCGGLCSLTFKAALASNSRFTGSVLCAAARAADRLAGKGRTGCFTLADIPPVLLSGDETVMW